MTRLCGKRGQGRRKSKKRHLEKAGKQTKWAPYWAVMKKYGKGKSVHPSAMTHVKRSWRTRKLKIKPRRIKKNFLG
jgi:ribosomal protein L39E